MSESQFTSSISEKWRETFRSLKTRDFRLLWLGELAMMGSNQMQNVARGYLTYDLTSSPVLLGIVSTGFAVPMLALALFGGALADRLDRKRVLQFCQGAGGLTALVIAISISTETITWIHLLMSSFMNGAMFAFIVPCRTSIIPSLVEKKLATNALALSAAAMSITTLLAPAIAGNLYILLGPDGVYYILGGLMFLAVIFTGMIRRRDEGVLHRSSAMGTDILAGLRYIRKTPMVMVLLFLTLASALLAMPIRFLLPIFIVDVYRLGPEALGLLLSIMGLGALLGSLAIAGMGRYRRGIILISGGFIAGIGLLTVALIPLYIVAVFMMILMGLGDAARRALNVSVLMEVSGDEYRGRVSSVYAMNFGLMPLGVLPAGFIAQYFGVQAAAGTLAVVLLIVCLFVLILNRPLRRMM